MKRLINFKYLLSIFGLVITIQLFCLTNVSASKISEATETCLDCHVSITPGIVGDWQKSRHSQVSMKEALSKPDLEKRVSSSDLPEEEFGYVIGCAECHMINNETHTDSFEHNDYMIHTVVSGLCNLPCRRVGRISG